VLDIFLLNFQPKRNCLSNIGERFLAGLALRPASRQRKTSHGETFLGFD
jgi:hypothetical protein